jgi:hypothetical protein
MFEEQTIQSRGICSPIRLSDEFVTQELASIKIASIQSWGLYGNCGRSNRGSYYAGMAVYEVIAVQPVIDIYILIFVPNARVHCPL